MHGGLIPYHDFTLPNGLRVYVHEHAAIPIVSVNLWYHVGSRNERPGRTGFAHLFEHLMFEGSRNVPHGQFDTFLEEAGGINNGSTNPDRTNYWETLPSTGLELALYLESDRMGGLLDAITQRELDAQRDVVKNERRQSYENRPYGLAGETILAELYPPAHPYHWPTIGSMADISAASLEDVQQFFRTYYVPHNATLAIAGDVKAGDVERLVTRYFGAIETGAPVPPVVAATPDVASKTIVMEDDVQLARVYIAWHSPALYSTDDAELDIAARALGDGKASRLYRSLVYERQVAQSVSAYQSSAAMGSTFRATITAKPGVALSALADEVHRALREMAEQGITQRELDRARNTLETTFIDSLQHVGGFGGRADQLNHNVFYAGDPGYADHDLARYRAVTTSSVAGAVRKYLLGPCITLSVVPRGETKLAVDGSVANRESAAAQ